MEETNKNEKFILFFKVLAIIVIGGFSCFLIGSFAFISIVNAEVNFINPTDMTYKNPLGSNPTYGTNCSVDGYSCVYLDNGLTSYSRFYTGNAGYNFPYTQLAVFNFSVVRRDSDQDTTIGSISLNGYSCYFNSTNDYTSNQQGSGDNNLEPYKTNASAYCPLSGTFAIDGRTKILEIRYTNQANISYVMLNRITFVSNGEVDRLIQLLSSSNSYFLTNNDLLSQINSKLGTIISNEQATTNAINNQTQQQQQNHDELMDDLNDSSTDDPTNDLEDMQENEISNSVISDLLLLPLNMFQRIINSINGTCSTFNLGSLYGSNLTLPCIDIPSIIGSSLWGVIDVLFSGIFVLSIRKKFVDIFQNITSLKDRGNELE